MALVNILFIIANRKKSSSNIYVTSSFMVTKILTLYLNKGQINFGGINVARKKKYVQCTTMFIQVKSSDL